MCLQKVKHVLKYSKEYIDDTRIWEKHRETGEDADLRPGSPRETQSGS